MTGDDRPLARNLTRRQRRAARPGNGHPGGVTAACGCRYARSGGWWVHVTPCRLHVLREWPVSDETMREVS